MNILKKRRCQFSSLVAYIVDNKNIHYRVPLNTEAESNIRIEKDRPPSSDKQSWGPWAIKTTSTVPYPKKFKIFVKHVNCPTEPNTQKNLFVEGNWVNLN